MENRLTSASHLALLASTALALALVALLILWTGRSSNAEAARDPGLDAAVLSSLEGLREGHQRIQNQLTNLLGEIRPHGARETIVAANTGSGGDGGNEVEVGREPTTSSTGVATLKPTDLVDLLGGVMREGIAGSASAEQQSAFWAAIKRPGVLDEVLASLEALVEANPNDADARMRLADGYTARLMTVPSGPEQGVWGSKAQRQWQTVVDRDPDQWEAQQALANNYSWYPDFFGKRGDAIRHYGECVRIQRFAAPEQRHVDVYRNLAQLQVKNGDSSAAIATLQEGLSRHPGDSALTAELATVRASTDGEGR